MYIDHQLRIIQSHGGSFVLLFHKPVGNSIFHPVSNKHGMAKFIREYSRIDGKCGIDGHIFFPFNIFHLFVHFIGIKRFESGDRFQHPRRCSQLQIGFVHQFLITGKTHCSSLKLHIIGSNCHEFRCEHFFQTLEGLGYHFKFHSCIFSSC